MTASWLVDGLKYAAAAAVVVWAYSWTLRRYQRCTLRDSNAPQGRRTDWRKFWGRSQGR